MTMKLHDYLAKHLQTPFEWGKHDCVLFANGWAVAATGIDYLAGYPTWSSEREARRLLVSMGGLEALLDKHFTRINPNLAPDGALALCDSGLRLVSGAHIVGPGETGLIYRNRTDATCAWHF
jgi:hypothetical protein